MSGSVLPNCHTVLQLNIQPVPNIGSRLDECARNGHNLDKECGKEPCSASWLSLAAEEASWQQAQGGLAALKAQAWKIPVFKAMIRIWINL